jgi:Transposase IS116/IS110/IS902 family.
VINKIKHIVRRHNLRWHLPTKTFPTQSAIAWLKALVLPAVDRLEMNYLLADLEHLEQRYLDLEKVIAERCIASEQAGILSSMPGVGNFTATALACRVGRVERFPVRTACPTTGG